MSYVVNQWIRAFGLAQIAPVQIFCFPHAGGTASYYSQLARGLAPEVEVLAIQYPGRQDRYREPCLSTIEELSDCVASSLMPHLDRPTFLFGHSMGAAVAFEVTRRLEARGYHLGALFASGCVAPSLNRNHGVHLYNDEQMAHELIQHGATDPSILADSELVKILLPTIRADYTAIENYQHREGAMTDCPIVVLSGNRDPYVNMWEAEAWRVHARTDFELYLLPGGHFFLDQQREEVLSIVRSTLSRSTRSPHPSVPGSANRVGVDVGNYA